MKIYAISSVVLLLLSQVNALENGLGFTPQMGWNTWNKFACQINETLIKGTADKIVEMGLDQLGYKYVNIDDCWMLKERDANGHMIPNPETFPSGMKALGDYLHEKGLRYGIYSSAGNYTCESKAGSLGHEDIDAQDWADWGIDYLKYDNCFNENVPAIVRYPAMRDALNKTGRTIFYSICNWGNEDTWKWGPETGNSWRTTVDIKDIWISIQYNYRWNAAHTDIARPGAWNDPDMLEIGNGGLTNDQEKSHFALWAVAKAPLILGCDLDKISQESLDIITNTELIAINQDFLGKQAPCLVSCTALDWFEGNPQVYAAPMENGDIAAVIINWTGSNKGIFQLNLSDIGITEEVVARDLWKHEDIGSFQNSFSVDSIPAYGNHAIRFRKAASQSVFLA